MILKSLKLELYSKRYYNFTKTVLEEQDSRNELHDTEGN